MIDNDFSLSQDTFKLLIVDDNDNNRFTLSKRLKHLGFTRYSEAVNGAEALEMMRSEPFHLVLCDIMMPVCDGYQVLEAMRDDERIRHIPIIMISALDEIDSVARCIELGAEDYLPKPFNPVLLKARIGACFEKLRLRELERSIKENHEPLTGLYSRKKFASMMKQESLADAGARMTIIRFKIDQMKNLIGSIGQDSANDVTRVFADRLSDAIRPPAVVACFDGDGFAAMYPGLTDRKLITDTVAGLKSVLGEPVKIADTELIATASMGIAVIDGEISAPANILRDVELALDRAVEDGGDRFHLVDQGMHEELLRRLKLESDLRRSIERSELEMFYQPIIDIGTERVFGFESLMRWRHPTRGLVSPGAFIPLAEETGFIVEMSRWALIDTTEQAARWREEFPDLDLTFNVNVSARQFMESDLLGEVNAILNKTGLPPNRLKLEITESVILDNPDRVQTVLELLEQHGVVRALDDFGTGYSSLSYLHRFPFTTLKIDRSFVTNIHENERNAEIAGAVIGLAHRLGMDTVAEGIETEQEFLTLKDMGADYAQGYYFGKPMDVGTATNFLNKRDAA